MYLRAIPTPELNEHINGIDRRAKFTISYYDKISNKGQKVVHEAERLEFTNEDKEWGFDNFITLDKMKKNFNNFFVECEIKDLVSNYSLFSSSSNE